MDRYYEVLEKLLQDITEMDEKEQFTYEGICDALKSMCSLMRVSKVAVYYYENSKKELAGQGEEVIYYDSGESGVEVSKKRLVTGSMAVVVCRVSMPVSAEPWSDIEKERAEVIHKTLMVFASRNRLKKVADQLTFYDEDGYRNNRYFVRYVQELADKNELKGKVVVQYNLRHFTLVNQRFGKNAGDMVMRRYTGEFENVIGDTGVVCRLGGDNFVTIFPGELFDEILVILSGKELDKAGLSGESVLISSTAGVYYLPDDFVYSDPGDILDRVFAARRAAKNSGFEKVVYYNEEMEDQRAKVRMVQGLFREAIYKEEFKVYYQPKVSVGGRLLSGAEALCRWVHDGEIVPPDKFIPILEQGEEICMLDFYMLEHVCRDISRWIEEDRDAVRVSVNFSRRHIKDMELVAHIISVIDKYEVPHKYIEIELTETTTDVEFKDLRRVVCGLQEAGIRTSVDDFGTGYSSLNLIRDIPWDVLKVDKCFLPNEKDAEVMKETVMFSYVVSMAKEMGLECVVEGVETEAQLKALKDNNCDQAQGFFFDKPMPVEDFEDRLSHKFYAINRG
ncbi:MAG TPA: GGDEF domain-containing protein [Lachnospiraceae bacterium]|nr:GGDEF domain-containing protein [Lachnospiraceae bacterium]